MGQFILRNTEERVVHSVVLKHAVVVNNRLVIPWRKFDEVTDVATNKVVKKVRRRRGRSARTIHSVVKQVVRSHIARKYAVEDAAQS